MSFAHVITQPGPLYHKGDDGKGIHLAGKHSCCSDIFLNVSLESVPINFGWVCEEAEKGKVDMVM